jgi:hypothetical protein
MSKPTVSAAGGAMPAEGQNIADAFDETRRLIIAASNLAAAAALDDTQAQGLHAVICAAEDKFMVAHNWFEAGGHKQGASATEASHPDPDYALLRVVDEIYPIRSLIECAWMAAADLREDQCGAMRTVLTEAQERLVAVRDKLDKIRAGAPVEDRDDV